MRLEPDSPRRTDEERRYFPDWTDSLTEVREEIEADHNSYLAGGYAEEFGYRAQPGTSRGVRVLDGEPPEESEEWHCQADSTHPGYPITPRPIALDGEQIGEAAASGPRMDIVSSDESQRESSREPTHGAFIRVTARQYANQRHYPAQRAAAMLTRLLAALIALHWELTRTRR